jgi:hypothetical protein
MLDTLTNAVRHDSLLLLPVGLAALLGLLTAGWLAWRAVRVAKSERPDDTLSTLGMLGGLGWSSEAVWTLTGPGGAHLPIPLRIALFAILEMILSVFMIRAKRNMKDLKRPGRSGLYAWCVAGGMSSVAVWTAHNTGEAFLRLLVPILLTTMWWDGLVGETKRNRDTDEDGRFNWTPRNLLIRLGAITPGKKDVKTVHRERLTRKMTDLYYDSLYGPDDKRKTLRSKLARLTLDADDKIVADVMRRVRRTSWTTAKPLPYDPAQPSDAPDDAAVTHGLTQSDASRDANLAVAPKRRAKEVTRSATSGDAPDVDPATRAAHLVMTQGISTYEAADRVGGTSEATVRRRVTKLRAEKADAPGDAPLTHPKINGHPVLAGARPEHEES